MIAHQINAIDILGLPGTDLKIQMAKAHTLPTNCGWWLEI